MGTVVVLRPRGDAPRDNARELTWRSLTPVERVYVRVVESDRNLFTLFDTLQRDYYVTKWFAVPAGLSQFEKTALYTMHRFVDELADRMSLLDGACLMTESREGESHRG